MAPSRSTAYSTNATYTTYTRQANLAVRKEVLVSTLRSTSSRHCCSMGKKKSSWGCFRLCRRRAWDGELPPSVTAADQKPCGSPSSSDGETTPSRRGHTSANPRNWAECQARQDSGLSLATQEFCSVQFASPASATGPQASISAHSSSTVVAPVVSNSSIGTLNITATVMGDGSSHSRTTGISVKEAQSKIKSSLEKRYASIFEGIPKRGKPSCLIDIYTDLYITKGESEQVNSEHEVWHAQAAAKRLETEELTVKCNDIFKSLIADKGCVLTKGIAGIGKTVSVQKFIIDWVDGIANTDITFIFPLPFRELNLVKHMKFNLLELIYHFFPRMADIETIDLEEHRVLFIFDGLDECQLSLNFYQDSSKNMGSILRNVKESASLDVLLVNLINGNLLPSALLWITSRPAAVTQIPNECVDLVTEIRGFNDTQKVEYFSKRFRHDKDLASTIIKHIKLSRSLYIMCHIPVFCWISATVLEKIGHSEDKPKTLTQMYTYFLLYQTNQKNQKYGQNETSLKKMLASEIEMILKFGEVAFHHLNKSNLVFYEADLEQCRINIKDSMYSGMLTEIIKEEFGFHENKIYCFVHLSIQEYLAALFVHERYIHKHENPFKTPVSTRHELYDLHKSAVDVSLESKTGQWDLFLRFLLGVALESNQTLLSGLLGEPGCSPPKLENTIKYIKQQIRTSPSPERAINLFHCLHEMNDDSLVKEIQTYLGSGTPLDTELSPDQCSALAYALMMSEEVLEEFNLKIYNTTPAGRRRVLPILRFCRRARVNHCNLTKFLLEPVLVALQAPSTLLTELDLGYNKLGDVGVEVLCASLKSSAGILQVLRLNDCNLTGKCCEDLALLLLWQHSSLKDLELRGNDLGDSGVKHLCQALKNPICRLQRLGLSGCQVTEEGCASLASAVHSNISHLKELDVSYNHPGDSGIKLLSALLAQKDFSLENLHLEHSGQCRNRPGVEKYACQLSLDPNTVNNLLELSEDCRTVTYRGKHQYPEHPERFDWAQVLCREALSRRCYWEVEWEGGDIDVAVAYKKMARKLKTGKWDACGFGFNEHSWSLHFSGDGYSVFHNSKSTSVRARSAGSRRIGVYLDWAEGVLAFYRISKRTVLLHQVLAIFTEPLYAGFSVSQDYSLSISSLD
ncbi:NACHT, LRR and PYD domains-containing protein 3-like isoform X2 [Scleropages formosus]|uniref:NACHT, LRR and PYD domains-containing protein 3-like isoform X2 n=1 Tax=Scleropages formosus TaxID=113540 RepID=UPI000879195C|nr:NACHT, LRR and PYD domains-containing protein 3-like isoform X2 [Scleropages formosus]